MYQTTEELKKIGFSINLVDSIIKRNNYSTKFNTSEFFCIYILPEDFTITVEDKLHHIKGGNAVFVGPQKNVELGEISNSDIYVITFSTSFYDKSYNDSFFLNSKIFFNDNSNIFIAPYFGNKDYNQLILIERLLSFKTKKESLYISAAHNTIESLILDAYQHINETESETDEKLEFLSLVNRFKILLHKNFREQKKVSFYAEKLNISTRKLTEITENICDKSAKQIIIEKIKYECEKSIKFSGLTLSEISYDLGFNDEGNFSNFVKKHIGKKPSEMREVLV